MEALQAQIEPHFLFNTLASIDQLIQTDPPRASKMQQSLIRYLRSAMPQMREGRRPSLGQQVDLCSAFLEIMAVRMEGRLQAVVIVPEGLKSAVFPSMMLQTLVENAIKHGLEPNPRLRPSEIAQIVDATGGHCATRHRALRRNPKVAWDWPHPRAVAGLVQRPGELIISVPPRAAPAPLSKCPTKIAPATPPADWNERQSPLYLRRPSRRPCLT